jgi:hypothetical protein
MGSPGGLTPCREWPRLVDASVGLAGPDVPVHSAIDRATSVVDIPFPDALAYRDPLEIAW